jgi:Cu/Ag efflux pump CusA
MTTFAMTAGMLPIALGFGTEWSADGGCAVGGLLSSTAFSLLVVQVVFTYVDGFELRLAKLWLPRSGNGLRSYIDRRF